jgi:hypothetical protein
MAKVPIPDLVIYELNYFLAFLIIFHYGAIFMFVKTSVGGIGAF